MSGGFGSGGDEEKMMGFEGGDGGVCCESETSTTETRRHGLVMMRETRNDCMVHGAAFDPLCWFGLGHRVCLVEILFDLLA